MMFDSIEIPEWMQWGTCPSKRPPAMRKMIYGGDTETCEGEPISFQFYNPWTAEHIWLTNPNDATQAVLEWCGRLPARMMNVVYIHNLKFDMVSFFWDQRVKLCETRSGEFDFTVETITGLWHVKGVYGTPTYCVMIDEHRMRTVYFVDSFSYYRASLAKAADVFCPDLPKLERPEGLGTKRFEHDDQQFLDYAMRDSEIAYYIGVSLEGLHAEFDIPQTISVAQMASKIFKRQFVRKPIQLPEDKQIVEASVLAYHGGKNNITCEPGFYPDVSSLDISSAYPHIMSLLPSFYHLDLYKGYRAKNPRHVPDLGVYYVSGSATDCPWPILFSHDFKALRGRFENIAVTGFELNEAIRSGEVKLTSVQGWFYDAERDHDTPPMQAYVNDFYARKEAEQDPAKRAMFKFLLNSLSGKYIQTRRRNEMPIFDSEMYDFVSAGDIVAGGMFHPFIAALITGHTRAKIHQMEHKYQALHTATDGIFTQAPKHTLPNETGLGALVTEAHGDLLVLRNKLYILYSTEEPKKGAQRSQAFPEYFIIKAALHGFAGDVNMLETLALADAREYNVNRANTLRNSLARGWTPNKFEERDLTLRIPPIAL